MLQSYLKITLRNLQKNGVYSFINIAGLSIGLVCSILILLWVNHELSWDNFHENRDRIYRVYVNGQGDSEIFTQQAIPLPLWENFKTDRDFANVSPTNWGDTYLLTYGEQRLYKQGYYAGDQFLRMFSFQVVKGDPQKQLGDPSTIVLTESTAAALFGNEEPIGKIVRVDDEIDLTVTGVVKDVPGNSSFSFECLLPFSTYMNREQWVKNSLTNWGNNSFNLYVEMNPEADPEQVEARLKDIIKKNAEGSSFEVTFHPMEKWRLHSDFKNGKNVGGYIVYVSMFTVIAIFILVIACINFMNLATARSERRSREVGIRKSIGSGRRELVLQFLGETLIISMVAFLIALGITEMVLPLFNHLVDKQLSIDYTAPYFWGMAVIVIIGTGLLAGSYPAFYLSSFQAAAVLKGKMQIGKKGVLPRKILVTLQFFFSIALIISTLVVYYQINHLKNRPVGYDQDNLIMVSNTGDIRKNFDAIKRELLTNRLASSVTSSSSPVTAIYAFMGEVSWKGKREDQRTAMATVATSHDYAKTLGITVKEGRDFNEDFTDSTSIVLNESAVAYMGLKEPLGETVRWDETDYKVVGVFADLVMASPNRSVDPTMFVFDPTWMSHLTIKLSPEASTEETLASVESIFRKYNPNYPFTYQFVSQEFERKFTGIQLIGRLANVFSFLAIIISCLGLFGLAAFTAEQRTKEIGIRKVLGASLSTVVVLISRDFSKLVIVAFVIAAPLSWWLMDNWLNQYNYRISIEWWILAVAGLSVMVLALVVVIFQALKAALTNPVNALRNE